MEVSTGSGKRHFWFKCTDKTLSGKRTSLNGIDVLGNGGVYGVGSNLTGIKKNHYKEYEIVGDNESIEPMPENIQAYLINTIKQPKKEIKTTMNTVKEGTRNTVIFNIANALSKSLIQQSQILDVCHHFNESWCDFPLPETEVNDIVSRLCTMRPDDDPIEVLMMDDDHGWDEEVNWLIEDICYDQGVDLFFGDAKVGKSTLLRQMAHCVQTGGDFLGKNVNKGEVLYLSLDESKWSVNSHRIAANLKSNVAIVFNTNGSNADQNFSVLTNLLEERKPKLVIIDTLTRFVKIKDDDLDNYSVMNNHLEKFSNISNTYKCLIILVHHTNKQSHGSKSYNGSTALQGYTNCQIRLAKNKVYLAGRRPELSLSVAQNDNRLFEVIDTKKIKGTETKNKIVECLSNNSNISFNQVNDEVDVHKTVVRKYLDELVLNGTVIKSKRSGRGGGYSYTLSDL